MSACTYGKTEHRFRVTVTCCICDRDTERVIDLPCRAHEHLDISTSVTPRWVGCQYCKRQINLYFYCEPLQWDYDALIRNRSLEYRVKVRNIDGT